MLFGLLAPLLVLVVAFGIDATAWHRDGLHLQHLADRAATSAGPLWAGGDRRQALAVAAALVAADGDEVRLDHAGAASDATPDAIEIVVSSQQRHLLAGLFADSRQRARAVAIKHRRIG